MHVEETDELVTYLGRKVPKRGFRAYIYSTEGQTKLIENWDEFDLYIHCDNWFASQAEATAPKKLSEEKKPEPQKSPRKKSEG